MKWSLQACAPYDQLEFLHLTILSDLGAATVHLSCTKQLIGAPHSKSPDISGLEDPRLYSVITKLEGAWGTLCTAVSMTPTEYYS